MVSGSCRSNVPCQLDPRNRCLPSACVGGGALRNRRAEPTEEVGVLPKHLFHPVFRLAPPPLGVERLLRNLAGPSLVVRVANRFAVFTVGFGLILLILLTVRSRIIQRRLRPREPPLAIPFCWSSPSFDPLFCDQAP